MSQYKKLQNTFYNARTTTKNPSVLAKRAGTTVKVAREFLKKQQAVQVTKQYTKPPPSAYAPTGAERGEYEGDVIFLKDYKGLNSGRTAIFTILETNSRYVYARALTKATALKLKEAMMEILVQNAEDFLKGVIAPIMKLRLDGGSEFKKGFQKLCEEEGVEIERGSPGTHEQLARIDRFHRTLRQMIGSEFERTGTHKWFNSLDNIIYNYNHTPNRGLAAAGDGLSPSEIGPVKEEILRRADLRRSALLRKKIDKLNIKPGDQVRLLRSRLNPKKYKKSEEHTFTNKVYKIIRRYGPNSFLVDVPGKIKVWPFYTMLIVKETQHTIHKKKLKEKSKKVSRHVVSQIRQLNREISEAERVANIVAVRGKRTKRIDYRKLAGL